MRLAISLRSRALLRSNRLQGTSRLLWTNRGVPSRPHTTRKRPFSSRPSDPEESEPSNPPQAEEPEPLKVRASRTRDPAPDPPQLPPELDILWTPERTTLEPDSSILPPPQIFDQVLSNLHICLHAQTQHRATYSSSQGQPVEPTLALYCPIEGGDYVIDATVLELARRTDAEVVVLDAVQLAAGEWGAFGEAGGALQLPRNPLHFSSSQPEPLSIEETVEEEEAPSRQVTLTLVPPNFPANLLSSATVVASKRGSQALSKVKQLFDSLVNVNHPDSTVPHRPRLIYFRDFPTLAPTSPSWYPHLLAAVRQRRRGPLSRPSSPVNNPMVIVFGMTPPLTSSSNSLPPPNSLVSLLLHRVPPSQLVQSPKSGKADWGEGDLADKQRERRLRDRLKRWESGDSFLLDELPRLAITEDSDSRHKPEVLIFGPHAGISPSNSRTADSDATSSFFRTSIIVPSTRSSQLERDCRVSRRREINELTMRMAVGAVGGVLEGPFPDLDVGAQQEESPSQDENSPPSPDAAELPPQVSDAQQMWDSWGRHLEEWSSVRQIADHSVGTVVADRLLTGPPVTKTTLEPTTVPWSTVSKRWVAHRSSQELRKLWTKDAIPHIKTKDAEEQSNAESSTLDDVVERLKTDGELDPHEQRLLPCIVDTASMTTTFGQVHLPPHTIDSVRTIVSLPLIHPQAFQQGILKEHGMTGCLLFGPPGVGKTLVVRALAKEAGCRMMVVTPADVMDMYVGEGEKLVKAVFSLARKLSPSVVFLDEIDALFGARMSSRETGSAVAHRGVITEFMQEMDGLRSSREDNVIVIGATNRPFDLDDAVLRRFPRRLLVDLPGLKEREEILKIHLREEVLDPDVDIHILAQKTESYSGSDLKHLCVSAALHAVKQRVQLPWINPDAPSESTSQQPLDEASTEPKNISRTLNWSHFNHAFQEITPSSSETLGSLVDLRRWNEEFGEGRKDKRKRVIWGKDRFGFTVGEDTGRAVPSNSTGDR